MGSVDLIFFLLTIGAIGTEDDEGFGGGLFIEDTHHTRIHDNTSIAGNGATWKGGGVYLYNHAFPVAEPVFEMNGGYIVGNLSGSDGGGLYVDVDDDDVTLNQVSVTQNASSGGKGGGAYIYQGLLTGSLTALAGNVATGGIPGIAYKAGAPEPTITVPPNDPDQQAIEQDP